MYSVVLALQSREKSMANHRVVVIIFNSYSYWVSATLGFFVWNQFNFQGRRLKEEIPLLLLYLTDSQKYRKILNSPQILFFLRKKCFTKNTQLPESQCQKTRMVAACHYTNIFHNQKQHKSYLNAIALQKTSSSLSCGSAFTQQVFRKGTPGIGKAFLSEALVENCIFPHVENISSTSLRLAE